jgi:hypothetical protein
MGRSQLSASATLPPSPKHPWLAHPNLVSDVIPQLHQDLVEEGELGDQRLGLLPCQGPGCGEAQNWGTSLGPSLDNSQLLPKLDAHPLPLSPTHA